MNELSKKIVEDAIDEINLDLEADSQLLKDSNTLLLSSSSKLDSLSLVRLLLTIERMIEERFGSAVSVVDESSFESEVSPFLSVGSLISHVENLLAVK